MQAWSSLIFHCHRSSFYSSGAHQWDPRPVSGASVAQYHLLHRPCSVSTALGPAPLVTHTHTIPLCWFESYLTGRSFEVAWGGEVSKAHQLVTGVHQGSVLGPLLFSTYTTSLGPIIQAHGFSYHFYADDKQLYLSFRPDDPTIAARISGCLADISTWMKEHHQQLNLAKTELLVFPATLTLQHDFMIQLGSSTITPSASVRNLGVIFDDQQTFKEHIVKTARSCRFALHNIRKIRPFLTEHASQLLVQALVISKLDYCNALLAGLP